MDSGTKKGQGVLSLCPLILMKPGLNGCVSENEGAGPRGA